MAGNQKYKVIVADRAKRMLGAHIRFLAQVNMDAAVAAKKKFLFLKQADKGQPSLVRLLCFERHDSC